MASGGPVWQAFFVSRTPYLQPSPTWHRESTLVGDGAVEWRLYDGAMMVSAGPGGFSSVAPMGSRRASLASIISGLIVVVLLWLTVVPVDTAARIAQLVLAVVAVVALVVRNRLPGVAVVVTGSATGMAWALGLTADPFVLTGLCIFSLAESRGGRRFPWWLIAAAGALLLVMVMTSAEGVEEGFRGILLGGIVTGGAWLLGLRTQQVRWETAARSRLEERRRLGRDVHDVLSHSLGIIGVRAGVAAHVPSLGETELRATLSDVEKCARVALTDLGSLMRCERASEEGAGLEVVPSSSSLSASLEDLRCTATQVGLHVELDVVGDIDALPAVVRTTVHRVIQEAVTNTVRHAAATTLAMHVQWSQCRVELEVRDDGCGTVAGFREGHGLNGMRERVELVGGTLHVESSFQGFQVTAHIPASVHVGRTI